MPRKKRIRTEAEILLLINTPKWCPGCQAVRPAEVFRWQVKKEIPAYRCMDCERILDKARRTRRPPKTVPSALWGGHRERPNTIAHKVRTDYVAGLTIDEIAVKYDTSYGRVAFALRRAGVEIPHRRGGKKTPLKLVQAVWREIHSPSPLRFSEIATKLKITRNAVSGMVYRYGLNDAIEMPTELISVNGNRIVRRRRGSLFAAHPPARTPSLSANQAALVR